SGVFTPTPVAPAGVTFSAPGQAGASFTGTINSNGLASTPIDATLENVVGNDLVKFSIVVENTGSGTNGAFDVAIKDAYDAAKFMIPAGATGLNLQVTDGTGRSLPYTGNLFGTGIELIDTTTYPGPGINVEWFNQGSDLVGVWSGSLNPTNPPYASTYPGTVSTTETFANTSGTAQFFHFDSAGSGNGQINNYRWSDQTYSSSAIGSGWFAFPARTSTATGDALRVEGRNNSPAPADLGVPVGYQANAPLAGTIVIPGESISSVFGGNLATAREMFSDGTNTLTFQAPDPATITQGAVAASDPTNGKNVVVITYDLQLKPDVVPLDVIPNTATLTNYASTEGGPNYLPPAGITDDTTVTIQAPAVTKTLVGT
ncbi:MAG: hypothetical protein EBZ13_13765, partial [Planctomycetia bacterium]|nr:hypothetical protein [Planctomycetia bacterium]